MSAAVMIPDESAAGSAQPHPPCPSCGDGFLLPMASATYYVCTAPGCTYTISGHGTSVTYYKGHATTEQKEKGGKRWVEFSF